MMITVVCLAVLPLLFLQCQKSLGNFFNDRDNKTKQVLETITYFTACHCQACRKHKNLLCFCFPQLQQHRCDFSNDSGGGLVGTQQLVLSGASAGGILEGTFGR